MKVMHKMFSSAGVVVFLFSGAMFAGQVVAASAAEMKAPAQEGKMQNDYYPCWGGAKGIRLNDEQQAKVNALMTESEAKVRPLHDQLFVKNQELQALQNASSPDMKAVNAKAMEINDLREQIRKERAGLGKKLDTTLGLKPGTHGNMGGYGNMCGYGHMGCGKGTPGHRGGCY